MTEWSDVIRLQELRKERRHEDGGDGPNNHVDGLIEMIEYIKPFSVLEIGSWRGVSTEVFALMCSEVTAVDDGADALAFGELTERMRPYPHVTVVKGKSPMALANFMPAMFDAVYIDGSHAYLDTANDITEARRLTRNGGWICGHDYGFAGVTRAVTEAFGAPFYVFPDSSWIVQQ